MLKVGQIQGILSAEDQVVVRVMGLHLAETFFSKLLSFKQYDDGNMLQCMFSFFKNISSILLNAF